MKKLNIWFQSVVSIVTYIQICPVGLKWGHLSIKGENQWVNIIYIVDCV